MKYVLKKDRRKDDILKVISRLDSKRNWSIEIKQWRQKRSNPQLAYFYAGIVNPVVNETGNDQQTVHDFPCGEFFGWKEVRVFDQVRKVPVQTLTSPEPLSVEQMSNFCEWCISRMAQEGILIESPREVAV